MDGHLKHWEEVERKSWLCVSSEAVWTDMTAGLLWDCLRAAFCTVMNTNALCFSPNSRKAFVGNFDRHDSTAPFEGQQIKNCCHVWVKETFLPYVWRNKMSREYLTSQLPADRHSSKSVWASSPARYTNMNMTGSRRNTHRHNTHSTSRGSSVWLIFY